MFRHTRFALRALVGLFLALTSSAAARAGSDVGIVMLHGLQGMPGQPITLRFENALRSAGYLVETPEMCWSRNRIYDAPYADCLKEIDTVIGKLKAAGATRIVIAGMSMGGNAVLGYAAGHPGLAGVIALAPAADPLQTSHNPQVHQSIEQARQMVAAGHGNDRATFNGVNTGGAITVTTSAAIYLSFADPDGPAAFTRGLPKITEPVLWAAGTYDKTQANADASFATLPANPMNLLVHVSSGHVATPDLAIGDALGWLKQLLRR